MTGLLRRRKTAAAAGGGAAGGGAARRSWSMASGDPASVLAEARKALFVMTAALAVLWLVQIADFADSYRLVLHFGIRPRAVSSLPDIVTAPFLHFSWTHLEGNSGPLFIFGFLAAYRGVARFAGVTALVIFTSGLGAWLFQSPGSVGAGASGVVFGYLGYIIVRGVFDRRGIDLLIGAVMALCFAYQFAVLLPQRGIGWQAHVSGVADGILAGWIFRDRRGVPARAGRSAGPRSGAGSRRDGPRSALHQQLGDSGL